MGIWYQTGLATPQCGLARSEVRLCSQKQWLGVLHKTGKIGAKILSRKTQWVCLSWKKMKLFPDVPVAGFLVVPVGALMFLEVTLVRASIEA